jgi:hypothetical protein
MQCNFSFYLYWTIPFINLFWVKYFLPEFDFKGIHADILPLQIQAIHCETLLLI